MNPVSTLIFNSLVRKESIYLPGIGSLEIFPVPAEFKKKGEIQPPYNRIELSRRENPQAVNIVDTIAQNDGIDRDDAQETYNQWLTEVCREEGVVIESVGSIRNDFFTPAPELDNILNPVQSLISLPVGVSKKAVLTWVILAILIGGGLSAGIIVWLNGREAASPVATVIPAARIVPATPTDSSATEETEAPKTPSETTSDNTPKQPEKKAENPAAASAAQTSTQGSVASADIKEVRYFVVAGTYSNETNANKFIAEAKKKDNSVNYYQLVLRNGKIMVYTFASANEAEANQAKNKIRDLYPDAWVYKHRPR